MDEKQVAEIEAEKYQKWKLEGAEAYKENPYILECPYYLETASGKAWIEGWTSANNFNLARLTKPLEMK